MPIYEYRCARCGTSFEALVRSGDDGVQCPDCRGRKLSREMSTFAARSGNGDSASAAAPAMCANGLSNRPSGGCCGAGGCGCH